MSAGLMVFHPAYRTPMAHLSITDSYLIELESCLHEIREAANSHRAMQPESRQYDRPHLSYLTGKLHGVRFGFSTLLIYKAGTLYDDVVSDASDRAMSEADFLLGSYISPNEDERDECAQYGAAA